VQKGVKVAINIDATMVESNARPHRLRSPKDDIGRIGKLPVISSPRMPTTSVDDFRRAVNDAAPGAAAMQVGELIVVAEQTSRGFLGNYRIFMSLKGVSYISRDPDACFRVYSRDGKTIKWSQRLADDDFIWPNAVGGPRDYGNLYSRLLKPAARRAGLPFVGWHTLRRTCATLLVTEHGFLPSRSRPGSATKTRPSRWPSTPSSPATICLPSAGAGRGRVTRREWVTSGSRFPPRPTPEPDKRLG
jgi:hypothetical protein